MLAEFPRVKLIDLPTALEHLPRLGPLVDHPQIYIKRDDLMSLGLGGNKLRHLEFWLGDALANGCDLLVACGLPESNQCRLTAAVAAKLGLECLLVHNVERPAVWQGNMLLDSLFGAHSTFIGPVSEVERTRHAHALIADLRVAGRRPYLIGPVALGALGYVNAAYELYEQARDAGHEIKRVALVGAMGGTASGFLHGTALLGHPWHVHVITVEYEAARLHSLLQANFQAIGRLLPLPEVSLDQVMTIHDQYLGPGYAEPCAESLFWLRQMASREGILLENTYTSKVVWGMMDLIAQGVIPRDEAVCFWHTGGTPALFGQAAMLQPCE